MKTNIIFNIGHVILGIIVGLLVHYFSGENNFTIGLLSIVTGLLTIVVLEVIFQPYHSQKEFSELASRVNYLVEKISERTMEVTDLSSVLKYGMVQISPDKVTDVWL